MGSGRGAPVGIDTVVKLSGKGLLLKTLQAMLVMLAVAVLGGACASVDDVVPPKVNLVNIVPIGAGPFEQRFRVEMRVSNPNNFDIPLGGLAFDMDVNGSYFATGLSNDEVTVPRFSSAVISAEATASSIDLFRHILNVVRTGAVEYTIKGSAIVGGLTERTIPFERDGKLNFVPDSDGRERLAPESAGVTY